MSVGSSTSRSGGPRSVAVKLLAMCTHVRVLWSGSEQAAAVMLTVQGTVGLRNGQRWHDHAVGRADHMQAEMA